MKSGRWVRVRVACKKQRLYGNTRENVVDRAVLIYNRDLPFPSSYLCSSSSTPQTSSHRYNCAVASLLSPTFISINRSWSPLHLFRASFRSFSSLLLSCSTPPNYCCSSSSIFPSNFPRTPSKPLIWFERISSSYSLASVLDSINLNRPR